MDLRKLRAELDAGRAVAPAPRASSPAAQCVSDQLVPETDPLHGAEDWVIRHTATEISCAAGCVAPPQAFCKPSALAARPPIR